MKLSANAARSLVASQSFPCSTSKSSNMPDVEASTKHPDRLSLADSSGHSLQLTLHSLELAQGLDSPTLAMAVQVQLPQTSWLVGRAASPRARIPCTGSGLPALDAASTVQIGADSLDCWSHLSL